MAQGKKSFIVYSDWKDIFDELPNEDAGALIKHIFAYVNDENPVSDSVLIKAVFANIKSVLKRDLDKWDAQLQQRRDAGKKSAEVRAITKINENPTVVESRERNLTDNVNDIDNVIEIYKLSDIKISDNKKNFLVKNIEIPIKDNQLKYFEIAEKFRLLFIKNLKEKNSTFSHQQKATYKNYVDPIRLMIEKKEATIDQIREAYLYLDSEEGEFWKSNILSTETLRKQISKVLVKKNAKKVVDKTPLNTQHIPDPKKRKEF